jgi:L-amino acid N-acyltransferase YncA
MDIVGMSPAHARAVLEIYQAGLDTGWASFEVTAPPWAAFNSHLMLAHRYVAVESGTVAGWVAVSPTSSRPVYAGVVEHSVYVAPQARGHGVGLLLLRALLDSCDRAGIWTVQTGVFPQNAASMALHARAGFRVVGTRERIGRRLGQWRDVVLLERRGPLS